MLNKKQKRVLITLDIVELIVLLITLIVFTVSFRLIEEPLRYVFLLGDIYVIYSFSKTLKRIEEVIEKRNSKKENSNIIPEISI